MALVNLIHKRVTKLQTTLANAAAKLDALSPLATLKRGYAIATDHQGDILRDASGVRVGSKLQVRLLAGTLDCSVDKVNS